MHLETGTIVFAALVFIAVLGVASKWLRMPYPIVFVLGGALLAFVPGLPRMEVKPDIVFLLFLPPLLYGGGFATEWRDFKRRVMTIGPPRQAQQARCGTPKDQTSTRRSNSNKRFSKRSPPSALNGERCPLFHPNYH